MNKGRDSLKTVSKYGFHYLSKGFLGVALLFCFGLSSAQRAFSPASFQGEVGSLNYQILMPKDFTAKKKYPLVLFLHGSGERGLDNQLQLTHGSSLFIDSINSARYPAIVIFPQCTPDDYWANIVEATNTAEESLVFQDQKAAGNSLSLVMELLDSMVALNYVDNNRIYVGGLSMGGMGTFELLSRRPNLFAAAFPICGGGNPVSASKYALNTPIWVFHGAKDDVVFPHYSVEMVVALQNAGASPKFNLYKEANHNSWDQAFAEPELLPWLFSQDKKK